MSDIHFPDHKVLGGGWVLVESTYAYRGHDAIYLAIDDGEVAVCDAGIGTSAPLVTKALDDLSLSVDAVKYLFISHAHLDHCAGAGHLMQLLPNAKLVCHERAAKHLSEPGALIQGARGLYGDDFDSLYGEVLATDANRVEVAAEGATYQLGARSLEVIHTPGHTFDHISVVDKANDTVFVGDSFGVWTPTEFGFPALARIPAAPTQFEPKVWKQSVAKIAGLGLTQVLMTHYGPIPGPISDRAAELSNEIDTFVELARQVRGNDRPLEFLEEKIIARWTELMGKEPPRELIKIDLLLSTKGVSAWEQKHLDNYDG